ncbi:MAG: hypothetical protein H6766_04800 [Candidatus Peribacteria bacterium]|nr:MAG: hypothetical protein H6766_04800 [Candidatus Peribacteria bacterium]
MSDLILLRRTGERSKSSDIIITTPQANNQTATTFGFNGFIDTLLYQ